MIKEKEYKSRRERLLKQLCKNSVAVLFASEIKTRSNDTEYPYRQNSNFYYMCGFTEDNSALMFIKKKKKTKTILFVEKKDEALELWHGKRLGEAEAKKRFLVDEVHTIESFSNILKTHLQEANNLYYDFNLQYNKVKTLKRYSKNIATYNNIALLLQKMRLLKSSSEVKLIQKAIDITQEAHHNVMKLKKSSMHEYELQAELEYTFTKNGAYSDAYTSIVAGGNAANTLHYVSNDKLLKEGKLILIDAGCEYKYYASDITRTIPVSGKFSSPQKRLYNMVLDVQLKIISMIKPGVKRSELHKESEKLLCEGLVKLGILQGKCKKLLKKQKHKKYYPHGIGHWMGIDVHDEAPYKNENGQEIALKKGMVLTIEPGIYIDENDKNVPKKYRGIGIRIEDDILVTSKGCKNMSKGIAKTVSEIEALYHS